jgi:hypothetical protein
MHLESRLHVFAEPHVQQFVQRIPALFGSLSFAYVTLHLLVTTCVLAWLYFRRPDGFAATRTALIIASGMSLIGFLAFPTAPPRLAESALRNSTGAVDLNHGLVTALYNPYAAVPSMHIGYAVLVGGALIRYGRSPWLRAGGALYPCFVLLVIIATGNHFFFDAAAGAAVAVAAALLAALCLRRADAAPAAEVIQLAAHRRDDDELRRAA